MAHVTFRPCSRSDETAIIDFLWSIKDDLLLSTRSAAADITQILFAKGGIIAGCRDDSLVAMFGYFLGEPSLDYTNKEVGFIYVTGIAKPYRLSRTMWNGMDFSFRHLHKMGIKEIRCHASEYDPYTNGLYSRFAKPLGKDVTLRGKPAILYGNTMEGVLAYLDKGRARQACISQLSTQKTAQPVLQNQTKLWHCPPCNVW